MLAVNYTSMRNNMKSYCDLVCKEDEAIIVTRKADQNVVLLSLERYNQMEKMLRNLEYLQKVERAYAQLKAGQGQVHELLED